MQPAIQTRSAPRPSSDAAIIIRQTFLASLAAARHETSPYHHWFLRNAVTPEVAAAVTALPFAPPVAEGFTGTREANNAHRAHLNPENQAKYSICRDVAQAFNHPDVAAALQQVTGARLEDADLRIEYCQDTNGFWLEPHTDIAVKRITMLIYLSDDPALSGAGTDLNLGPPDYKHVGTAPYGLGLGLIFVPGSNTWHSVRKRDIKGVRKTLIINWVGPEWRARDELV